METRMTKLIKKERKKEKSSFSFFTQCPKWFHMSFFIVLETMFIVDRLNSTLEPSVFVSGLSAYIDSSFVVCVVSSPKKKGDEQMFVGSYSRVSSFPELHSHTHMEIFYYPIFITV